VTSDAILYSRTMTYLYWDTQTTVHCASTSSSSGPHVFTALQSCLHATEVKDWASSVWNLTKISQVLFKDVRAQSTQAPIPSTHLAHIILGIWAKSAITTNVLCTYVDWDGCTVAVIDVVVPHVMMCASRITQRQGHHTDTLLLQCKRPIEYMHVCPQRYNSGAG